VGKELRDLVRRMAEANPTWGAPRIHGELKKLGIEVSERTASNLIPRRTKPPSQKWRTFLKNHTTSISFCSHNSRRILPISLRILPKITLLRYFGTSTTWYRQYHLTGVCVFLSLMWSSVLGLGGSKHI
jgi:hypothetical protein